MDLKLITCTIPALHAESARSGDRRRSENRMVADPDRRDGATEQPLPRLHAAGDIVEDRAEASAEHLPCRDTDDSNKCRDQPIFDRRYANVIRSELQSQLPNKITHLILPGVFSVGRS